MRKFLISLTGFRLEYHQFRDWKALAHTDDWVARSRHLDKLTALLARLPPLERDILELYFFKGKREAQIARMLAMSQQSISYRMYVAFRRISFMVQQPQIAPARMRKDLTALIPTHRTVDILCDWAVTSSQTATAARLHLPLQLIGEHVKLGLAQLRQQASTKGVFYASYFGLLIQHRNIYREVLAGPRRKIDAAVLEAENYAAHFSLARGAGIGKAAPSQDHATAYSAAP